MLEMERYSLKIGLIVVIVLETNVKALDLTSYFDDGTTKSFEEQWLKHQASFESALNLDLSTDFGHKSLNVYVSKFQNPLALTSGFYHTDNQVKIVFLYMALESLPHIFNADVTFPLHSNVFAINASVSKMIVHTTYRLFRNKSDIIYDTSDQDPNKNSPFRFQQVRNKGELAITVEGCILSGFVIATISSNRVNLGHNSFKLSECQYTVEIYTEGLGSPPVITQYLPTSEKGINLEHILVRPLVTELMPKLQAAMFSYIKPPNVIGKDLNIIIAAQEKFFERTQNFLDAMVRNMNKKTLEKNMGTVELGNFNIAFDDEFETLKPNCKSGSLTNIIVLGLDSLYCSHDGGPYKLSKIEIAGQLRFTTLQVTGKIVLQGYEKTPIFAVEITDLAVNIILDANFNAKFDVIGWRYFEFSSPCSARLPAESVVVGYLQRELPQHIVAHLNSVYDSKSNGDDDLQNLKRDEHFETVRDENNDEPDQTDTEYQTDFETTPGQTDIEYETGEFKTTPYKTDIEHQTGDFQTPSYQTDIEYQSDTKPEAEGENPAITEEIETAKLRTVEKGVPEEKAAMQNLTIKHRKRLPSRMFKVKAARMRDMSKKQVQKRPGYKPIKRNKMFYLRRSNQLQPTIRKLVERENYEDLY